MISEFYKQLIIGLFKFRLKLLPKDKLKIDEYKFLGDLCSILELNDKASNYYLESINRNIADKDVIKSLGKTLAKLHAYDKALNIYQNADINTLDCEIIYQWGKIYEKLGNFNEALKKYNDCYNQNPNCYFALFSSANILEELGLYKESLEKYKQALKISPNNSDILIGMGLTYDSMGEYKKAIRLFQKTIAIDPKKPEAYFAWGTVLEKMNDTSGAKHKYALALKYDPLYSDVYCRWGELLFLEKDYQEAIKKFKQALNINSNNTMAIYNLACTYNKINLKSKAVKYLKKLLSLDKSFVEDIIDNPNLKTIVEDKNMINILAV